MGVVEGLRRQVVALEIEGSIPSAHPSAACKEQRSQLMDSNDPPRRPAQPESSPLDVEGVDLGVTADEIVAVVREGRERRG